MTKCADKNLLLAFIGIVCLFWLPDLAQAGNVADLRVVTYNVESGETGRELTATAIRRTGADIVCLQMTAPDWEKFLEPRLGLYYPNKEFRYSKEGRGGGVAFLSKIPARETAHIPSTTGGFDAWIMEFDIDGKTVQILSVHLHPPADKKGILVVGAFSGSERERLAEIKSFYERLRPGVPAVVLGDFSEEEGDALDWLEKQGMKSALVEADDETPTWQKEVGIGVAHRRIDHIFYSRELQCIGASVIKAGGSTHRPVSADLKFGTSK